MKTHATTLYPFVPSGTQFARGLEFFAAMGFEMAWRQKGLAGLRFGGAYFLLQDINVPAGQRLKSISPPSQREAKEGAVQHRRHHRRAGGARTEFRFGSSKLGPSMDVY